LTVNNREVFDKLKQHFFRIFYAFLLKNLEKIVKNSTLSMDLKRKSANLKIQRAKMCQMSFGFSGIDAAFFASKIVTICK